MKSTSRRLAAGVVALGALIGGSWVLGEWEPFAYDWPDEWDPRVAQLADYVERHAEFSFEHPVRSRFLPAAAFEKLVTADAEAHTDDHRG
ncbi:MAG: hypothetical protein ACO3C5_11000, partial [Ilumatobacteraceae bacterium]